MLTYISLVNQLSMLKQKHSGRNKHTYHSTQDWFVISFLSRRNGGSLEKCFILGQKARNKHDDPGTFCGVLK